jgi:hypothetical protein
MSFQIKQAGRRRGQQRANRSAQTSTDVRNARSKLISDLLAALPRNLRGEEEP